MKYAVVEEERREAQRGLAGKCPVCDDAVIPKCGLHRVPHWAHRETRSCDHWWEPETARHRTWKNHFPKEWQERIHQSQNGEKHIADVKTDSGVVLEFQNSYLRSEERESRENFYSKMVWVVNARKRERDRVQFFASLDAGIVVANEPRIVLVPWKKGALLRDWGGNRVPVYFDFGDSEPGDTPRFERSTLLRLNPCGPHGMAYLVPVSKTEFLRVHLEGEPFEEPCTEVVESAVTRHLLKQARQSLPRFERYMARRRRPRF